jgi:hypothetical protein
MTFRGGGTLVNLDRLSNSEDDLRRVSTMLNGSDGTYRNTALLDSPRRS